MKLYFEDTNKKTLLMQSDVTEQIQRKLIEQIALLRINCTSRLYRPSGDNCTKVDIGVEDANFLIEGALPEHLFNIKVY